MISSLNWTVFFVFLQIMWSNKTNCKIDDKGKESEYNPQVHVEGVDKNVVVKVVEPTPG